MNIKTGDTVEVISGKSKGQKGKVIKVFPKFDTLVVENVNKVKKHVRRSSKMPQSGIFTVERPVARSKVMLVCPITGKRTRIGKVSEGGKWKRYSKKAKVAI
jgi:large subunit ribosomal protein L24